MRAARTSVSLNPGRYIVRETQQAGWTQSFPANNVRRRERAAGRITLTSGQLDSGNDFGNCQQATKTGMKFNDLNANGVKDQGEPGLAGWTITAYVDANANGIRDAGENTVARLHGDGRRRDLLAQPQPGPLPRLRDAAGRLDQSYPGQQRLRHGPGRLGDQPHVGPARLRQRLRQLPAGHQDGHEVQRPERQRREGRRASPDWPAGRSSPSSTRTATASATTTRTCSARRLSRVRTARTP